jgi:hypothetical protein
VPEVLKKGDGAIAARMAIATNRALRRVQLWKELKGFADRVCFALLRSNLFFKESFQFSCENPHSMPILLHGHQLALRLYFAI